MTCAEYTIGIMVIAREYYCAAGYLVSSKSRRIWLELVCFSRASFSSFLSSLGGNVKFPRASFSPYNGFLPLFFFVDLILPPINLIILNLFKFVNKYLTYINLYGTIFIINMIKYGNYFKGIYNG